MKEPGPESEYLGPTPASHSRETSVDAEPLYYEIRVGGRLDDRWAAWFGGLSLTRMGDGTTLLAGPVADQAALYGLLERMRDLGLSLLNLNVVRFEGVAQFKGLQTEAIAGQGL